MFRRGLPSPVLVLLLVLYICRPVAESIIRPRIACNSPFFHHSYSPLNMPRFLEPIVEIKEEPQAMGDEGGTDTKEQASGGYQLKDAALNRLA